MDAFAEKIVAIAVTLIRMPLNPGKALCLIYLTSALVIALTVLWLRARAQGRPSIKGVLSELFPRRVWWHRSARVDYMYLLVNSFVAVLIFAPVLLSTPVIANGTAIVLEQVFGAQGPALAPTLGAQALLALALVVALDLGFFVAHYLMHRVGWLWEFHKVHHSAEVLTPVTNHRSHPVQSIVFGTLIAGLSGIVLGIFDYTFDYDLTALQILGVNAAFFVFMAVSLNLQHSHVWISFGALDRIFVSPAMHQVHHSVDARHLGKNLGAVFSVWDALAGTRYLPDGIEELRLGLGDGEEAEFQSVARLYAIPFRNVIRRARTWVKTRDPASAGAKLTTDARTSRIGIR